MKKYAPYALFVIVVVLLFWMGFRWYVFQNQTKLSADLLGEGVNIENLSETEMRKALGGVQDYTTVELEPVAPSTSAEDASKLDQLSGVIRYEIDSGKLKLGVVVATADETTVPLRVWIRKPGGSDVKPLFTLEKGKGGLVGSAQLEASLLPLEVLVSAGTGVPQDSLVLRGTINPADKEK